MWRFVCAIVAALALCFSSGLAGAETKTFDNPKIGPNRLDWCVNWGTGCGEPAATAWCKSNEYDHAVDSKQAVDIGAATPTKLIATGEVCDQAYCDGFTSITCATAELPAAPSLPPAPEPSEAVASTPLPQVAETAEETFKNPIHEGVRLNWCFSGNSGCGKKAAEALVRATRVQQGDEFQVCQRRKAYYRNWHRQNNKKGRQRLQPCYLREVNQLPACHCLITSSGWMSMMILRVWLSRMNALTPTSAAVLSPTKLMALSQW